jgi:ABC-type transport system involved in multi-copper enzyme maturation permease subunit
MGVLADPVAGKELRSVSRRWQTYVGRVLFVAATGYLIYQFSREAWKSSNVSAYAQLSRQLFFRCEAVTTVLTVLAAVIAASDMLAREIRNGSLGLLLLTDLTPGRVVLGKWKGAMMIALSLYLCSVPVLGIAVYLGGVGPVDLLRSATFTIGLTAVGAAVALRFSARMRSPGAAAAASVPMTLWWFAVLVLVDMLGDAATAALFGSSQLLHHGGVTTSVVAVSICALHLGKAVSLVRERTALLPGPDQLVREQRALQVEEYRELHGTKPPRMLSNWRSVWQDNPLLWKEFTLRPALRLSEGLRTTATFLVAVLFFATWVSSRSGDDFFLPWGVFFILAALMSGSLLFAPEKENHQWALLLSTPVTPTEIIRAKLIGGLVFPEIAGIMLLYLLSLVLWLGHLPIVTMMLLSTAATLFILFAYALAAAASFRAKTARGAFLFAAGIVALLVVVPPFFSGSWIEALSPATALTAGHPRRSDELLVRFFSIYLPATLALPLEMVLRFRRVATRT